MISSKMRRTGVTGLTALAVALLVAGCAEETPTSVGDDVLPGAPVTLQIELPWEEFGDGFDVIGGYGAPGNIGTGVVATDFAGALNARSLMRFGPYPASASVRDTTETTVTDTNLTYIEGRVVAFFTRRRSTATAPVTLTLGLMDEPWHRRSATWEHAVDTLGQQVPWSVAGGGTVTPIDTVSWDPAAGDSVSFPLDSAQVATWADAGARGLGARLDLVTEGHRLDVRSVALRLTARPSVNPDTVITLSASEPELTFVYDPVPPAPADGVRVGGAPAWRTVMDLNVPVQLQGPPALCAAAGCPVTLEPGQISYAAVVLTTRRAEDAYQPLDSLGLDARGVLDRSALPKSPLGSPLLGSLGRRLPAPLFGDQEGVEVEVPVTSLVRNILRGIDPATQRPYPNTLALLSPFEPISLSYLTFQGPGSVAAPMLRLVVTVGPSVELP